MVQSYPELRTTKYKFDTPAANIRRYGKAEPPAYDLGKITNRGVVIIGGNKDAGVSYEAIKATSSQLRGKSERQEE